VAPDDLINAQIGGSATALAVMLDFIGHLLSFRERTLHASTLDGGDMDEYVLSAVVGLDEAVAFRGVKEFHGSGWHVVSPLTAFRGTPSEHLLTSPRAGKIPARAHTDMKVPCVGISRSFRGVDAVTAGNCLSCRIPGLQPAVENWQRVGFSLGGLVRICKGLAGSEFPN
jgi:hypothetical protein